MFGILVLAVFGMLFFFAGAALGGIFGGLLLGQTAEFLAKPYELLLIVFANALAFIFLSLLRRKGRFEPPIEADDPRLGAASLLFFGLPLNRRVLFATGAILWAFSVVLGVVLSFQL